MAVYHLEIGPGTGPLCDEMDEGDQLAPEAEARRADGRHFNCVRCHKRLTGGRRHMAPPVVDIGEGWHL